MSGVLVAVPHRLDHLRLLRCEQSFAATHLPSRPCRGQSRHSALPDQLLLELRQSGEEMQNESAGGGTGVELLFERNEVDAALLKPVKPVVPAVLGTPGERRRYRLRSECSTQSGVAHHRDEAAAVSAVEDIRLAPISDQK